MPLAARADDIVVDGYRTTTKRYIETTLMQIRETAKKKYAVGMPIDAIDEHAYWLIDRAAAKIYSQSGKKNVADTVASRLRVAYDRTRFDTGTPELDWRRMEQNLESKGYEIELVSSDSLAAACKMPLEDGVRPASLVIGKKISLAQDGNGKFCHPAGYMYLAAHDKLHNELRLPSNCTWRREAEIDEVTVKLFSTNGEFQNMQAYRIARQSIAYFKKMQMIDPDGYCAENKTVASVKTR